MDYIDSMSSNDNNTKPKTATLYSTAILSHTIVQNLFVLGVPFECENGTVKVPGFSKAGYAVLTLNDKGQIEASTRYNEVDVLLVFEDLVNLAYNWWQRYKDRSPFETPPPQWVPHFQYLGLTDY